MHIETTTKGLVSGSRPESCTVVIFGASGDLSRTTLLPSLFALEQHQLLPENFAIVGTARSDWNDETFRDQARQHAEKSSSFHEEAWKKFADKMSYFQGDVTAPISDFYEALDQNLQQLQQQHQIGPNVVFHLSMPPSFYGEIVQKLGEAGLLNEEQGWRRVILEKPFGHNEPSARELDQALQKVLREEQIYRIDHYLGKETVQNILAFRFANSSFDPIWNREHVDHVQITAAEKEGIGTRAGYYDKSGVVRDMVQNHLLSLLSLIAVEPPASFAPEALRKEMAEVLKFARPLSSKADCVLGQYAQSEDGTMKAYREEENVADDSTAATFAACKLWIDNPRWSGVPFYLRTGKRLSQKLTEITIQFKPTPQPLDEQRPQSYAGNRLTFRLSPTEGIAHCFLAKRPGPGFSLEPVTMEFQYDEAFGVEKLPGAYEWLLHDVMQGDQSLFPRSDWIYHAWSIVDPVIREWENQPFVPLPNYSAGSWGPEDADQLLKQDHREWYIAKCS